MTSDEVWGGPEAMRLDYTETIGIYKALVDIRFRLLSFVPTISGVSVALLGRQNPESVTGLGSSARLVLGIGLIGMAATLGVVMYEIRNSQVHDQAIHRLKHLSKLLGFRPAVLRQGPAGFFDERGTPLKLGPFSIWHDRALATIYGSSVAAWAWLIYQAATEIDGPGFELQGGWASVVPLTAGLLTAWTITGMSKKGRLGAPLYTIRNLRHPSEFECMWSSLLVIVTTVRCGKTKDLRFDRFPDRCNVSKDMLTYARAFGLLETEGTPAHRRMEHGWKQGDWSRRYRKSDGAEAFLKADSCVCTEIRECERREMLTAHLLAGVVGATDLWSAADKKEGRAVLIARCGTAAPWCSQTEVDARYQLLKVVTGREVESDNTGVAPACKGSRNVPVSTT